MNHGETVSELSFLLSLLFDHKLGKATKDVIKERIKEIEAKPPNYQRPVIASTMTTNQPASTQKILDEMAAEGKSLPVPEHIAQTAVAAQALASRQQAIAQQVSGVFEKGRTSPRKF